MAKKKLPPPCSDADKELFLSALEAPINPSLARRVEIPQQPKATARPVGPEAAIDLHACTLEQALKRTEEFLLRCQVKKYRKVLIIHGKGSGILKEGVRKYLEHHAQVADIKEAERQHGGSGAVIVILRRQR